MMKKKKHGAVPRISVVNESTLVADAEVQAWVPALQIQVSRDFAPIWGIDALVQFVTPAAKAQPADWLMEALKPINWVLGVFDNADQAGALGYHDLTPAGMPIMKIFAKDTADAQVTLSSVASHELLETLADPWIESVTVSGGPGLGTIYA